jgi:ribosomal peptide maturation radical SAM protein 1
MPFGPSNSPSLALSLFRAALTGRPYPVNIRYYNLRFCKLIGQLEYSRIASGFPSTVDLLGEWIFSDSLFGPSDDEEYFGRIITAETGPHSKTVRQLTSISTDFLANVRAVKLQVSGFLEDCAGEIVDLQPRLVGFTSVFQQNVASLALAQMLKKRLPNCIIVFGGANCEREMGAALLENFDFVDHVFSGEADLTFPEFCDDILAGSQSAERTPARSRPPRLIESDKLVTALDNLPYPDHDDFFFELQRSGLTKREIRVPFETARGCWWGQKHHCTFCGLNGGTMAFRSKSPERAYSELLHLTNKYRGFPLSAVDNIIDVTFFKSLLPKMAEKPLGEQICYEVKSNLKEAQVKLLAEAGITLIQPGIESLSSEILGLMKKGVTGIQNIQLLKWCKQYAVRPEWNFIWGFPREPANEYARMRDLLPAISHLPPPGSAGKIRMDRFSPNFNSPEHFGFCNVRPFPSYAYVYTDLEHVLAE